MAERSNAAVLKTVEGHTSGGSNPSFSANSSDNQLVMSFSPEITPNSDRIGCFFFRIFLDGINRDQEQFLGIRRIISPAGIERTLSLLLLLTVP